MSWNHRLLAYHHEDEGVSLKVHEVYYDKQGKPNGYTSNPITIEGESKEDVAWVVEHIGKCLDKPILWAGSRFPEEYIPNV
jgi:hypothetical protein